MRDIRDLLKYRSFEEWVNLLGRAIEISKSNPDANWGTFQDELGVGAEGGCIIQDWLADSHSLKPRLSNHWIKRARVYVLNNQHPSLAEMTDRFNLGYQTALKIVVELGKKKVIKIRPDFTFEKSKTSSEEDLIKQMKQVAKRYRGRCVPELLMRSLYVDEGTAKRLSEYGARKLGLRPKRWRD